MTCALLVTVVDVPGVDVKMKASGRSTVFCGAALYVSAATLDLQDRRRRTFYGADGHDDGDSDSESHGIGRIV